MFGSVEKEQIIPTGSCTVSAILHIGVLEVLPFVLISVKSRTRAEG